MRRLSSAFIDLVFILVFQFAMLWMLSMILINLKSMEVPAPKPATHFIMTTTWAAEDNCDIDSWAQLKSDPSSLTGYSSRENSVFILHNDNTSSTYGMVDGQLLEEARETLTVETLKTDTFQFSIYGFAIRESNAGDISVRIRLEQVSPYKVLVDKVVTVGHHEEVPIAEFHLDSDGILSDLVTERIYLKEILNR